MLRRVLAEPLFQFLAIAALLIAGYTIFAAAHDRRQIVVTRQTAEQLTEAYRLQYGTRPVAGTRDALVNQYVDDEILYREALALGLDKDDEIVRRRLIQKMRFLTEDLEAPADPTATQLENFYRTHGDRYVETPKASFSHIFFSFDTRGDSGARSQAAQIVRQFGGKGPARAPDMGDPFPDNYDFAGYDPQQVERLFGRTEFSRAVFSQPAGRWTGPFRSAYGWHLLRVNERRPSARLPLDAVRNRVRADYLEDAQKKSNVAAFTTLKSRYAVVRQDQEQGR